MINVFANYFYERNDIRRLELEQCVINNYNNKLINYILIESNKRLSYNDFFNIANKSTRDNDINIICNLDIYFNNSVIHTNQIKHNQFYALSRWDQNIDGSIRLFDRADSQDVWIWRGKTKNINGDFLMGKPGCDNRLAKEADISGYQVLNPSKTIQTIHVHKSNVRNYKPGSTKDTVPGPYMTVPTISL